MTRRIAVRAIVAKGNTILCVRLNQYKPDMSGSHLCLTGGGVDEGEALVPALEREMLEETGIKPTVGALLYIQQFTFKDTEHLEFFFHVTNYHDYEHINLDKTSHGTLEIAEISFVDPRGSDILPVFLGTEDIAAHIAAHKPPLLYSYI